MNWYFNAHGIAEGPHDDGAMRAAASDGRITRQTMVWHPGMPRWQEAGAVSPRWWQRTGAIALPLKPVTRHDLDLPHRSPTPLTPVEIAAPAGPSRLLKKWFGRTGVSE